MRAQSLFLNPNYLSPTLQGFALSAAWVPSELNVLGDMWFQAGRQPVQRGKGNAQSSLIHDKQQRGVIMTRALEGSCWYSSCLELMGMSRLNPMCGLISSP